MTNPTSIIGEAQTVSLDSPGVPKMIAAKIKRDIDDYAIRTYFEAHRNHLGASLIGHECSRYLWYVFRWCGQEEGRGDTPEDARKNLARMQRLFNRGHREEDRYVEFLKGIGAQIWTHQPLYLLHHPESEAYWWSNQIEEGDGLVVEVTNINEHYLKAGMLNVHKPTPKQFRMNAVGGHFGGSLDGIIRLPSTYRIDEPLLAEFKTNGTGAGFKSLIDKGVSLAKQQHFTQMSCYGNSYKLRYAAYFNTNKNDDDMYIEVIKLDWNLGQQMIAKAERIIRSQEPLPKLSLDPTFHTCAYCPMKPVCHDGKPPEMNCRSCMNCEPRPEAQWNCNFHGAIIPAEVIPKGCPSYKAIVNG